jgi:hypothetical protein
VEETYVPLPVGRGCGVDSAALQANVVQTMVARGATGTNLEIEQVIDYLTAHFGP